MAAPRRAARTLVSPTGFGSSARAGVDVLHRFQDIGTDEVHLIPTSANIDQLRRVAEVVKEFA
jgi:hypothetical protein